MGEAAVWRTERINQIGYVGAVARYRVFALTGTAEWSVGSTKDREKEIAAKRQRARRGQPQAKKRNHGWQVWHG